MVIVLLSVVLIVIFAGLVVLLRQIMRRYVTSATAHLQSLSQDYLKRQDELKQRSLEGDKHYQEQVVIAKADIERLRVQAAQEADVERQRLIAEGRAEGERLLQKALESEEALKQELERRMEARVIVRACELVRQVLPGELREAIQSQWLDELISDGLAGIPKPKTKEQLGDAKVVSAFPLSQEQRQRLRKRLEATLGTSLTIQEQVDPALIAGLTVTVGHLVFDGSLASKLQRATRHVQRATE